MFSVLYWLDLRRDDYCCWESVAVILDPTACEITSNPVVIVIFAELMFTFGVTFNVKWVGLITLI